MHLIEVTPAPCINCGKGNAADRHGDRPRFVDLERDVNWNEPVILCEDCIMKLGGLIGMASIDSMKDLRTEIASRNRRIHDLEAEIDSMSRRAKKLGITFDKAEVS